MANDDRNEHVKILVIKIFLGKFIILITVLLKIESMIDRVNNIKFI